MDALDDVVLTVAEGADLTLDFVVKFVKVTVEGLLVSRKVSLELDLW